MIWIRLEVIEVKVIRRLARQELIAALEIKDDTTMRDDMDSLSYQTYVFNSFNFSNFSNFKRYLL